MSKKILIAEDERPMATALEMKLKSCGFQTKTVSDGKQALEELNKNKYDLMLLDLMMPKLDGFGVLEAIQKKKINIKVIVSTNLSQNSDMLKVKKLGALDYLVKSNTSIMEVVDRIKLVLKS